MFATMADAHREWHWNAGVPMGTPGCPQDACHQEDWWEDEDEEAAAAEAEAATAVFVAGGAAWGWDEDEEVPF